MIENKSDVPVKLSTERFDIRSLAADDASARYIGWLADQEIVQHLNTEACDAPSIEELKKYISEHDNYNSYLLGVFNKDGEHIGNFRIQVVSPHGIANMGVMIGDRNYWGKNVVLECRETILDYLFYKLELFKVVGACTSRNMPALFNYLRQGWYQEGLQRGQYLTNGNRADKVWFAMFREDWVQRETGSGKKNSR